MDISDAVVVKSSRLKSLVWNDFDRVKKGDTCVAVCRHCKKKLSGSSTSGTSHLRNHLIRCQRRSNHGIAQFFSAKDKKNENALALVNTNPVQDQRKDEVVSLANYKFDHEHMKDEILSVANTNLDQRRSRYDLARMIILHGYPVAMVEHVGFRVFVKNLQPSFELVSLNRVEADCLEIYAKEKQKVHEVLDKLPGKISITADVWAATNNAEYLCLTAYYVDDAWQLRKKILSFFLIDPSQTEESRAEVIMACLMEWDIDRKLFSITFDNGLTNDGIANRIRDRLSLNRFLHCNGQLFDVRCVSNVLNLMAHDALEALFEVTEKIRQSIRCVQSSRTTQAKFNEIALQVSVSNEKCLCLDNSLRWDSTYLMLETALDYMGAFSLLREQDPVFKMFPSDLEWERTRTVTSYLKQLVEVTNVFTRSKCLTANLYFTEVCEFHLQLIEWCKNPDDFLSSLAAKMRSKFDEYWGKCSTGLAVAAMLDPRFKMKLLEYYYTQLYGNSAVELIDDVAECIKALYNEHSIGSPLASLDQGLTWEMNGSAGGSIPSSVKDSRDRLMGFDKYLHETSQGQGTKSDLDKYLEEPLFPRAADFNILNWWKVHTPRYPILSMMARNILGVPMSKAALECAFSTRGRMLDRDWSSLSSTTVQALMCSQDWIKSELEG